MSNNSSSSLRSRYERNSCKLHSCLVFKKKYRSMLLQWFSQYFFFSMKEESINLEFYDSVSSIRRVTIEIGQRRWWECIFIGRHFAAEWVNFDRTQFANKILYRGIFDTYTYKLISFMQMKICRDHQVSTPSWYNKKWRDSLFFKNSLSSFPSRHH